MNPHISEEYDAELLTARNLLMEMGGLVEQQVHKACQAFVTHDFELAESVTRADKNAVIDWPESWLTIINGSCVRGSVTPKSK